MPSNYISFNPSNESIQEVGKKAIGLLSIQEDLIPQFIILKVALFQLWRLNPQKAISELDKLIPQIVSFFVKRTVIIRSSASKENFEQRGYYKSSRGDIALHEIKSEIIKLWNQNLPMLVSDSELNFGLIIQEYIKPVYLGHLSNERRLSNISKDWRYELFKKENEIVEKNSFQINEEHINKTNPVCRNKTDLIKVLKEIAASKYNRRIHIEWVWDGNRIWIVQIDYESIIENGDEPGIDWKDKGKITDGKTKTFKTLKTVTESKKKWKKADCVKDFSKIGLPTGEVYLIEDSVLLENINKNIFNELEPDLNELLLSPIVIRTDINKNDKHTYLLPRTETLFEINQVKNFLKDNLKKLLQQGIKLENICFLLHRFIISKSCALAFSKPDIPRIRIDSTWGIVDGLYYHPHDSFEFNSSNGTKKEKIRCKIEYLDIDKEGNWVSKKTSNKYDWKKSLTIKEIEQISSYNEKLATFLGKPVTVMYFVDVLKNTGYPKILPWYYTVEEIPESSEKFSEIIFSEKKIIISTQEDFENFESNYYNDSNKITLQLKLVPNLLRDRDFLEKIGTFSFQKQLPIELEGSILSHPYYILKKKGAIVKVKDPFDPLYPKQEFYKLVRDKIPIIIESKGENVKAVQITSAQTLELIKQKLIEEAFECFWEKKSDNIIEELADIYELLRGASKIFDIDIEEIKRIADKKKEKRGGFDKSVFLIETKEEPLIKVENIAPNEIRILMENDNKSEIEKESLIPIYKKSSYLKETLSIPYIPSLVNSKSKKREEYISIDSNKEFIISFDKKKINVRILNKEKKEDKNQFKIDFGE